MLRLIRFDSTPSIAKGQIGVDGLMGGARQNVARVQTVKRATVKTLTPTTQNYSLENL